MTSILNQVKAAARLAVFLLVAYFAIKLWQDPAAAADATVGLIGGIGRFFASLLDRMIEFGQGFAD